jgi:hypothetical protein
MRKVIVVVFFCFLSPSIKSAAGNMVIPYRHELS